MIIGSCIIELSLPGVSSLKEKRGLLKHLIAQLHRKFHVALAEVDLHDVWQSSTLGAAVVSTSGIHAEQVLDNVVAWIEHHRPDLDVIDHHVEIIHV